MDARVAGALLLACLFALPATGVLAEESPEPAADPACASLFPFGVQVNGRPDRATKNKDQRRAKAVEAALTWLQANQVPTGAWEAATRRYCNGEERRSALRGEGKAYYDVGVTGIAVCAFLSAGYHHLDGLHFAETIGRALSHLVEVQDEEGCIGPRTGHHYVYNHAFATLALVVAFGTTGDTQLRAPARKALAFSLRAKNPYFVWRYGVRPGDNDTSVTGCMSLPFFAAASVNEAAEAAGLVAPFPFASADEADDVYPSVRRWLGKMSDELSGRVGYLCRGGASARSQELVDRFPVEFAEPCTAVGLVLRDFIPPDDVRRDEALLEKGVRLLLRRLPRWAPKDGHGDLFYWYFGSLALSRIGGKAWDTWRDALEKALLPAQRTDTDPCAYLGSWPPSGPWGMDGGRVYSTGMAVLALQAAWRFPKLEEGREDLVEALADPAASTAETVHLLGAVRAYGLARAGARVIDLAAATEAEVRAAVAAALGTRALDERGAHVLTDLLRDPEVPVRRAAAAALEHRAQKTTASSLVAALEDADPEVRVLASRGLAGMGRGITGATGALQRLLEADSLRERVAAAAALARTGARVADVERILVAGRAADDTFVRADSALGLTGLAQPGAQAQAAREALRSDPAPEVRLALATGLAASSGDADLAATLVVDALATGDVETRSRALDLVADLGPRGSAAAPYVITSALAGPYDLRFRALRALEALGPEAPGVLAALRALRADRSQVVRERAQGAVAAISLPAGRETVLLAHALGSPHARVVASAVSGLAAQGSDAVAVAEGVLRSDEQTAWPGALRVLAELGRKARKARRAVLDTTSASADPAVLQAAARALGGMGAGGDETLYVLGRLADDESPIVSAEAVRAIGALAAKDSDALEYLTRIARREDSGSGEVRAGALRALGGLGKRAKPALDVFGAALRRSSSGAVRDAAAYALARQGKDGLGPLMKAAKGPPGPVRSAGLAGLLLMGRHAKSVAWELSYYLRYSKSAPYDYAITLARMGKPALPRLIAMLESHDDYARCMAAWTLGMMGPDAKPAVSRLKRLSKDDDAQVRKYITQALRRIQ